VSATTITYPPKDTPILPELLQKPSLFILLLKLDQDLAAACQAQRCPHCGSRLDRADYMRKPGGGSDAIDEQCKKRLSLCCSNPDCRRRTLPPSTRFDGRRVYWRCAILVVMALRQNRLDSYSIGKLQRMFGISRTTIKRWIQYFQQVFPASAQWQRLRGLVIARVGNTNLPGDLLQYFLDCHKAPLIALINCLIFMAQ